jgi:hypothetical protein
MPRSVTPHLHDIIEAIDRVRAEIAAMTLNAFEVDWRTR